MLGLEALQILDIYLVLHIDLSNKLGVVIVDLLLQDLGLLFMVALEFLDLGTVPVFLLLAVFSDGFNLTHVVLT